MTDQGKANYEGYYAAMPGASPVPFEELPYAERLRWDAGACSVELWLAEAAADEDAPGNEPAKVTMALVDARCGHPGCAARGTYRMIGRCSNCGTAPLLGMHTVTHETRTGDCPACGTRSVRWDRLATPDEIPAGVEDNAIPEEAGQ